MTTATQPVRLVGVLCLALWLASAALPAQSFSPAQPEEVGLSSERLERVAAVIQEYVDQGSIAGAVSLVARRGKLVHHQAIGMLRLEDRTPMPEEAIFRIASMSKAVTSTAILMLHEEGRLLLTDPVSKFIPEFKEAQVAVSRGEGTSEFDLVPAQREITLRDLLTHTAGLSYGAGPAEELYREARLHGWYFAGHDEPIGQAVRRLAGLPLSSQPGERWIYGFGTDVLGHVVEKVSGMNLAEFFQTRIFEPLKMEDTHFYLPGEKLDRFTPVYGALEEGGLELREAAKTSEYVAGPRVCYSGGAGLLSTARDYARFLQMLLNGGSLDGAKLLSPKSVELMTVNHVGDLYGDRGFSLGFWVNENLGRRGHLGSVGAYGWGGAYYTQYWVDPVEELVAVFMTQLLPSRGLDLQAKFNALVYQSILESYR